MPVSAAAAYRADVIGRESQFGPNEGGWIAVATILERATRGSESERAELLRESVDLARDVFGESRAVRLGQREWGDRDRSASDVIVLLADEAQHLGALNLAGSMLDSLLGADPSLSDVQRGRVLLRRARVDWKLGRLDSAMERCEFVESLARRAKSDELRASVLVWYGAISQMRGNYPQLRSYARRAARVAGRAGLPRLAREAHVALMIVASVGGGVDEALRHGWRAYRLSSDDVVDQSEIVANLGQVLLNAGLMDGARAALSAVVARELPPRILLPALGGLAIASANLGHTSTVEWVASEVARLEGLNVPRHPMALVLLECAIALAKIGMSDRADRYRRAALELATAHRFFELVVRAEDLGAEVATTPAAPARLGKQGASINRELAWLEPERLPSHVSIALAPV